MNQAERETYVKYRLETAHKTFEAAKVLAQNEFWNSTVNRLYYAAFYAVNALLVHNEIYASTHSGVRNQFSLHFIKTNKIDLKTGIFFSELFDWRQKGDYGDMFEFHKNDVELLFDPVLKLLNTIEDLIEI